MESDLHGERVLKLKGMSPQPKGKQKLLIVALVLAAFSSLLFIGTSLYQKYQTEKRSLASIAPSMLLVNTITPSGSAVLPESITLSFSEPVEPHILEHFFLISPQTPGTITKGSDETTLTFTPTAPFERGIRYSVLLGMGLTSKTGKRLRTDYTHTFTTELDVGSVQFVKNGLSGKVLSFPATAPITFTVQSSKDIHLVTANLYRSSDVELLAYLSYKSVKENYPYDFPWGEFHKATIAHAPELLVNQTKVPGGTGDLSYSLTEGIYYVEAVGADQRPLSGAFIIVNRTGIVLRQDDQQVVLSAYDLATGASVDRPITVRFYTTDGSPRVIEEHTLTGIGSWELPYQQRLDVVLGEAGDERMLIPVRVPFSQADIQVTANLDRTYKLFLYTDRPIYKPGDTMYFRGVARVDGDGLYSVPSAGTPIRIWVDGSETPRLTTTAATDGSGTFFGSLTLPTDLQGMTHYLYASGDSSNIYGYSTTNTYFDVSAYVKPEYDLTVDVEKAEYLRSDRAVFQVTGKKFDGTPLADTDVTVNIYSDSYYEAEKAVYNSNFNITSWGGMCGGGFGAWDVYYGELLEGKTVHLDAAGRASISVDPKTKQTTYGQKLTVMAQKTDRSGNQIVGAATTVVHASEYAIFFAPAAEQYKPGEEIVMPLYAETLEGVKLPGREIDYKITGNEYNDTPIRKSQTLSEGKVTTSSDGRAIIRATVPPDQKPFELQVNVSLADAKGNLAQNLKYLRILATPTEAQSTSYWDRQNTNQTFLKIVSDKSSFIVGDTLSLSIRSPQELDALVSFERGRIYEPRVLHLTAGDNLLEIPIGDDLSPSITAVFSFFADGAYHTEGLSLNVPAMHKLLDVNITADKERYNPNDTAQLTITTRDNSNTPIPAELSLAVVDRAIFAIRKSATPPMHSSFYYFRPRRTNASSSLTWIATFGEGGRGGGGGGGDSVAKLVDTLYWNPNLQTDAAGSVTVGIPLRGITTTWRASAFASTNMTQVGQGSLDFVVAQ